MDYLLNELTKSQGALHIVKQISRQCDAQSGLLEHYGNEYYLAKAIVELADRIAKLEANHG